MVEFLSTIRGDFFMSTVFSCVIAANQIEFTMFCGVVEDVQNWTTHETWSEGGGGYVHPQYGGYVQAPSIHSQSTHHIRLRVAWEGGRRSIIDLPGYVKISQGDRVTFLAGENKTRKLWQWVGVINFTIESFYLFGELKDIIQIAPQGFLEHLGVMCLQIERMGGEAGAGALFILGGLLSLAIAFPFNFLTGSRDMLFSFSMSAILVVISTLIGRHKMLKKVKAAIKEYDSQRKNILRNKLKGYLDSQNQTLEIASN
jgi:hypothetical protein